jgi:hypothetical protein
MDSSVIAEKTCTTCNKLKNITLFGRNKNKKSGVSNRCKSCAVEQASRYYIAKKEQILEKKRNSLEIKAYKKQYDIVNKEKNREYSRNRSKEQKERKRLYEYNRLQADLNFKLKKNLRNRLWKAAKGISRSISTLKLLGCSIEYLKEHLTSKFSSGMSWSNYGMWHIDHIISCAKFDLTNETEQQKCFHYTNLQPLWAVDNFMKGSR